MVIGDSGKAEHKVSLHEIVKVTELARGLVIAEAVDDGVSVKVNTGDATNHCA